MKLQYGRAGVSLAVFASMALSVSGIPGAQAQSAAVQPRGMQLAFDKGSVAVDQPQTITVFLKMHDRAGFDAAVQALYDPQSASYHKWFTAADFARYAPTAAELKTVKDELERNGLTTVSVDPQNFSMRVRGTTDVVENAFHTRLHTYSYNHATFQAPISEPRLAGAAGDMVASTLGLERHSVHPEFAVLRNPKTGQVVYKKAVTATSPLASVLGELTGTALAPPREIDLSVFGQPYPKAIYYGPVYSQNYVKVVAYTPAELQQHYGLTAVAKSGYNGAGQTIALLDAYGYAYAESDGNLAAQAFGLPALTSQNFSTIYPEGKPLDPNAAELLGWDVEIALDIQSAHAIAPGAKILEVASAGQDDEDQAASMAYIIGHRLADTVSCSWENDAEIIAGPAEEEAFNTLLERGAAAGISFQFASGDTGDQGLGTPVGAVSVPSNSPYATAVGARAC